MTIVDYKQLARSALTRLKENPKISAKNKADFEKYLQGIEVSPARLGIIACHIRFVFEALPDVVGTMHDRDLVNKTYKNLRNKLTPGYFETVKKVGKAFVRWHNDGETPKGWVDIRNGGKDVQKRDLTPKDMVTWEDGLKLADASGSVQFKAIILTQLDAGMRPSEFIGLRYGDIEIKKGFAVARVNGKTGKRSVILFKSVPHLRRWLDMHPTKVDTDPLWVSEKSKGRAEPYKYHSVLARTKDLARKLKLKKPVDFYNLRHSACYLSKLDNVNPELAARKFGHSVKYYTDTYARLDTEDDIKRYAKHYGASKEKGQLEHEPAVCEVCGTCNEPGTDICEKCRNPLSMAKALEMVNETQQLKEQLAAVIAQVTELSELKAEIARRQATT